MLFRSRVAFTTGAQNAKRFSLDQVLAEEIAYAPQGEGKYNIHAFDKFSGEEVLYEENITLERIKELLGKEIADKVARNEGKQSEDGVLNLHYLRGKELKIEAKGMRGFYDKIIPAALKKLLPKLGGGKIDEVSLPIDQRAEGDKIGRAHV